MEMAGHAAVASAVRTGIQLSVAVFDLDGLKTINDTYGHSAGDLALAGMSTTLKAALRQTDQLFRVGGDEFVALLPGAAASMVDEIAARAADLNAPRFSWGVASAPQDGTKLGTLLEMADARLYANRHQARPQAAGAPRRGPVVQFASNRRYHLWSTITRRWRRQHEQRVPRG
jgi:diguanylate cyclase (GGDEF)-like protein